MNQQPPRRPQRRPATRAEYERMRAARAAAARRQKQQRLRSLALTGIIALLVLGAIIFSAVKIAGAFTYKDPNEVFGDAAAPTVPDIPTAPSDPPKQSTPGRVTMIAAGDNLIHSAIFQDAQKRAGGNGYDFISMYSGLADIISGADIAYVNQETPMAGAQYGITGYPTFNTPQEAGDALVALGFDTVNIATNHMLDQKTNGLSDSIAFWKSKPVTLLGAYTKADYDNIRTQTVNGVTIAWLSYTYGTNGNTLDSGSDLLIPYIDEADIRRQAALAKQAGDIVIASMHWGTDSAIPVDASQKKYAKVLADCGVDIIIGTHSHTLQPVEWITSSDGSHKTLCYYSLGNLINTGYEYYKMVGGLASFTIVKDSAGVHIEDAGLIPTMCHYSKNRDGLQLYTLDNYTAALAAAHGSQEHGAFTMNDLKKLVTDAIPTEFRK